MKMKSVSRTWRIIIYFDDLRTDISEVRLHMKSTLIRFIFKIRFGKKEEGFKLVSIATAESLELINTSCITKGKTKTFIFFYVFFFPKPVDD